MTNDTSSPVVVRVLVVDDSAFARKVMREVLDAHPRIEVVGVARDGVDALEMIAELKPDVIALDLVMPQLNGVGVLDALAGFPSAPRVVVVTNADAEGALVVAALLSGAYSVIRKPTAQATDRLYELGDDLAETVLLAAEAGAAASSSLGAIVAEKTAVSRAVTTTEIVVVGASTGGPRAITQLLHLLPATFPVPIAVVVHMPAGYTDAFAARLNRECPLKIVEAEDGFLLRPGLVAIARAGVHMRVMRVNNNEDCRIVLDGRPVDAVHRPSVDALFESAAAEFGDRVLGVVLTGMGSDGFVGARAIRARGGQVIAEHESTCVVYGMPRTIVEEGLADAVIPLPDIAAAIISRL
jgi:two-component system chemotaxis response regulator CheB